jgi:peptide/nickel transport system permease protein
MKRTAVITIWIVCTLSFAAVVVWFAVMGLRDPTATFIGGKLEPLSWMFPMGTDHLGRDVLSRLVYATVLTLSWTLLAVLIAMLTGSFLGIIAGYKVVPFLNPILLFIGQMSIIFPMRWLPLLIAAIFGNGSMGLLISMVFSMWGQYFWMIYDETKALNGRSFMKASRMLGGTKWKAVRYHALPHLLPTIMVLSVVKFRFGVGLISTLSFLGVGMKPPTPTWGIMIAEGHPYLLQAWWIVLFPTLAIAGSIIAVNKLGSSLEQKLRRSLPLKEEQRGNEDEWNKHAS